jgi:hypothetical protein
MRLAAPLLLAGLLAVPAAAQVAKPVVVRVVDSTTVQVMTLRDGSRIIGRTVEVRSDSVRVQASVGAVTLAIADLKTVREVRSTTIRNGEYWFPNPNDTRLLFAPTGRQLAKGEGYFSDHYLLFLGLAGGITDRVSLGGGLSILPSDDLSQNIFYITPKVGVVSRDNLNIAAGALMGFDGFDDDLDEFGVVYGVATFGPPDKSLTIGAGATYNDRRWSSSPAFMIGADLRLSRRTAFVTENYVLPSWDQHGVVSYGIRFFGEKMSVDLAFLNPIGGEGFFPGIPYVDFVIAF